MKEAKNVVINLKVTSTIFEYLQKLDNYSEYIRRLVEKEMEISKKRGQNKRLV